MRSSFTRLYVHYVWATWDRQPLLTPAIECHVYKAIQTKCREFKCDLIAIGGDLDHVHLLVQLAPAVAPSRLAGEVKGASSHLITHEIAPHREFKWQGSYGACTVSPERLKTVCEYVKNQKTHHAERRTFDGWEKCYEETQIPDERK